MSKASKRGYEDFDPSCTPMDLCPYKSENTIEEYLDGWRTADLEWEAKQDEGEEDERFKNLSYSCPWHDNYTCQASDRGCSIDLCAVYYFIKELK